MKKFLLSTIFILIIIAGYGQKEVPEVTGTSFAFENELPGDQSYNFKASEFVNLTGQFRYNPIDQHSFHAVTDPLMVIPPVIGEFGGPNTGDDGVVGSIPGGISVGSDGAANYQIPIEALPGINGMAPTLSLVYNSNSGNGLMGMGWMIGGLSAISRAGTNIYHEGFVDGVDFDENDKLVLNGNRLIPVGDNEYRTEIETFSKVEAMNVSNGWPEWFKVYTKSGYLYEYGNTEDSRIQAPGRVDVLSWQVNKISDRKGNYINFQYTEEFGQARISTIEYANDGTGAINSMVFYYSEDRIDPIKSYLAGCEFELNRLLDSIQVNYTQTPVRTYVMDYDTLGFYSRLSKITLWDEGRINHFNPTTFKWGEAKTKFDFKSTNITNTLDADIVTGDFNGDGKTDVVTAFYNFTSESQQEKQFTTWSVYYSNSSEGTTFTVESIGALSDDFSHFVVLDFNGDGQDDLVEINDNDYNYIKSEGTGFSTPLPGGPHNGNIENHCEFAPVDLNGNGIGDLLLISKSGNEKNFNYQIDAFEFNGTQFIKMLGDQGFAWSSASDNLEVLPGDFNGDGKTEILIETQTNDCTIYGLNETENTLEEVYAESFFIPISSLGTKTLTGDINGDGITDLITVSNDDPPVLTIRLLNGKDQWIDLDADITFPASNQLEMYDSYYNYIVSDFNGDNKSDVLLGYSKFTKEHTSDPWEFEGRHWDMYYSDGTNVIVDTNSIGGLAFHPYTFDIRYPHCDFNGDGKNDNFIFDGGFSGSKTIIFFHKNEQTNLIQKVTNGLGTETKISFEPITNNAIYTKGSETIPKVCNIQNTMHVVDTLWQDDGLGGWFNRTYTYEGAKIHLEGKGFLGFSKRTTKDLSSGTKTESLNEINPTNFFPYPRRVRMYSGADLISEKRFSFDTYEFGSKRIFYYPNMMLTNVHNTGDEESSYVKTIRQEKYYASGDIIYGNPTKISTYIDEDAWGLPVPGSVYDYYTINSFQYDYTAVGDWLISRPLFNNVETKAPDDNLPYFQDFEYEYYTLSDPLGRYPLLKSLTYTPNNQSTFQVSGTFDYDSFGNLKMETIATPNYNEPLVEDRITEYEYSPEYHYRFLTRTSKFVSNKDFIQTNEYYESTGLLKSTTDINGQVTSYFYDGFGRMDKTVQPNGVQSQSVVRWNIFQEPEHAVYYRWQKTSGMQQVFVFMDKLGRDHKTWTNNFDDQTIVADKTYYPEGLPGHGKLYKETEPYFPDDAYLENEYQWLPTGQLKKLIGPVNTIQFSYNGLSTTTENLTSGQTQSQTENAIGQLSNAEDPCGTVSYYYKSHGQPYLIENNTGNLSSSVNISYDNAGFRDIVNDPDAGEFLFDYNPYGELVKQTNARGFEYDMVYDALGRMTEKTLKDPMQTTTYTYDGENALGLISSVTGHNGISENYYYNGDVQLISKTETIEGQLYEFNYEYDVFGRLKEESWPTGFSVNYKYLNGYLGKVVDKQSNKVLWELSGTNARNQIAEFALGNNLNTTHEYDEYGFPKSISTSGNIQHLEYDFDPQTGNLNWRKDYNDPANPENYLEEIFGYDDEKLKSRLTSWAVTGGTTNEIGYLDNGNIEMKSDVGNYQYDVPGQTGGPHAVKKIEEPEFNYLQIAPPQHVTYTPFDKVNTISHPGASRRLNFTYDPHQNRKITRLYQTDNTDDNILLQTKYFIGGNYEIEEDAEGNQRKLHYLSATTGLFAIFVQENEGENMFYIHKDYLGSIQSITDEDGELVERLSFDPWGRRRNPDDWSFSNVPENNFFDRGYTGHQHLDKFGLINMNGRVYDPIVARFLSPDPFLQNAGSTQGYNRYSYVSNNPLKYTDPSGYVEKPDDWNKKPTFIYGFGPGYSGTGLVDFQEHGHAYWYDWYSGKYLDLARRGKVVDYQEVYDNFIVPNSVELPSNANINSIEIGQKEGIDGIWYTTSTWDPMARLPGENLSVLLAGEVTAKFAVFGNSNASLSGVGLDWNTTTDGQKIIHIMKGIRDARMRGSEYVDIRKLFNSFPKYGSGVNLITGIEIGNYAMTVHMNLAIYNNMQIDIYPSRMGEVGPFNGVSVNGIKKEGYWDMMELQRMGGNLPILMIQINANFDTFYNYLFN